MSKLIQQKDFTELFIDDTPLIDIRAPIEFKQGAFPSAYNLPLMSDDERRKIGVCYHNKGQTKAIELGYKLVQGDIKQQRLNAWLKFSKKHPNGILYCFRGGVRSQIAQAWMTEAGVEYPRIKGGYKALRRFLIDETRRIMTPITSIVIGGRTGCGKTLLLDKINHKIDLEGLANHRGSAFGGSIDAQPTQIDFENALAIALIKQQADFLVFEDEGRNIGALNIPQIVQNTTSKADLLILTATLEQRLQISLKVYVLDMLAGFKLNNANTGFEDFCNYWLGSLSRIQKRLGGVRYKKLYNLSQIALELLQKTDNINGFYPIIESLLVDYYDPMYDYQLKNKSSRIIFQGNADEVLNYIESVRPP